MSMQCDICGTLMESVDDTQIERHGRFSRPTIYCETHKPLQFIVA
jgi:hypothetical protein